MKRIIFFVATWIAGIHAAVAQMTAEQCQAMCVQQAQMCKSYCKGAQCDKCALVESSCPQQCQAMSGAQSGAGRGAYGGAVAPQAVAEARLRPAKLTVTWQVRRKLTDDNPVAGYSGIEGWEELQLQGTFDLEIPDIDYADVDQQVHMIFRSSHRSADWDAITPKAVRAKGGGPVRLPAPRVVTARGTLKYESRVTRRPEGANRGCQAAVQARGGMNLTPEILAELEFGPMGAGAAPEIRIGTAIKAMPVSGKVEGNCGARVTAPATVDFPIYSAGSRVAARRAGRGLEGAAPEMQESGEGYEETGKLTFKLDL